MINLTVIIEIRGVSRIVGHIAGTSHIDARFSYAPEYLSTPGCRPISISLPLQTVAFSPVRTRNFFEGLLPEGFTRRCVAERVQVDENDYISLLSALGSECLGAIKVVSDEVPAVEAGYRQLSMDEVQALAREGAMESAELVTKAHLSLTGASGKVGLYYDEPRNTWYLPIGDAPSTHIVKQSHVRLKRIVTNEQLCLLTASALGIDVPESFIITLGGNADENILFATRRYDRNPAAAYTAARSSTNFDSSDDAYIDAAIDKSAMIQTSVSPSVRKLDGHPIPCRLHQEDFSQALGIPASEKYEKPGQNYLVKMFDALRKYAANPLFDQLKLWNICIFNYLIGNTDNHIKNLSLLYDEDLRGIHLAPAYDIVSTVIYDSSTKNMAMNIGGLYKLHEITRETFAAEAKLCGLGVKHALAAFDAMAEQFPAALDHAADKLEKQGFSDAKDIAQRIIAKRGLLML